MAKIEIKSGPAGPSHREKLQLFLMIAALLVLGFYMFNPAKQRAPAVSPEPTGPAVAPEPEDLSDAAGTGPAGVPFRTAPEQTRRPVDLERYPAGETLSDAEAWAAEPVEADLNGSAFTRAVELACDLYDEEIAHAAVPENAAILFGEKPEQWIGRVFSVKGNLHDIMLDQVTLPASVGRKLPLASFMYHGRLRIEGTDLDLAVKGVDIGVEYVVNRPVIIHGIFIGMYPTEPGSETRVPLLVFKTITRVPENPLADVSAFQPGTVLGDPAIWALADDKLKDVIEKEPYYHALEILTAITRPDLEACLDPDLEYSRLVRLTLRPDQLRGRVYRLKGKLLRLEEKTVDERREVTARLPHTPYVFVGQVMEKTSNKPFTFRVLDVPENIQVGDLVEMDGIYVKVFTYPNRMGENYFTRTPLVMGKFMKRYEQYNPIMQIVGVIAFVVAALVVWLSFTERRRAREFERRTEELKNRRRQKMREEHARQAEDRSVPSGKEEESAKKAADIAAASDPSDPSAGTESQQEGRDNADNKNAG